MLNGSEALQRGAVGRIEEGCRTTAFRGCCSEPGVGCKHAVGRQQLASVVRSPERNYRATSPTLTLGYPMDTTCTRHRMESRSTNLAVFRCERSALWVPSWQAHARRDPAARFHRLGEVSASCNRPTVLSVSRLSTASEWSRDLLGNMQIVEWG